jgi:predicted HAD superfamily hydrolase
MDEMNHFALHQKPVHETNFIDQLDLVDFVSFDLFDTLIQRNGLFSPKDLFYLVREKADNLLGVDIDNFPTLRTRAEGIARARAWGRGKEEISLDEIYSELDRLIQLDQNTLEELKKIELECERAALTVLESGKQLFQAALSAAKTIIIITDTYFKNDFITDILHQKGYSATAKVYVSSVYGKTKTEGSLYSVVLKELGCVPAKLLHIGDNPLSDVAMALSNGIRAYYLPTPKHLFKYQHQMSDMPSGNLILSAMLCETSNKSKEEVNREDLQSVISQTAIHHLSFLYFAFSAWLLERLKKGGYKRVYFAARDGLIIKRFFDLVAHYDGFEIDSRYLYVSRSALYPSLIFTEPETARLIFGHHWDKLSIENALQRISLTYEECADLLRKYKLASRRIQLNGLTNSRFSEFLKNVWPLLKQKNEAHYQLLVEYLEQELFLTEEKAAFVDIGWHGSLQNSLIKLLSHLGITKKLEGLYLGTFARPVGAASNFSATGYLIDNNAPRWICDLVRCGPSLIEIFHSAGHGCVLGYRRKSNVISPVLEDNSVEQEQYQRIIKPMQECAFHFVSEQLKQLAGVSIKPPNPALISRLALRAIYAPTIAEASAFGRLKIATDFGAQMKSITGAQEWDIKKINGDTLPDHTLPIWRPGFEVLKQI